MDFLRITCLWYMVFLTFLSTNAISLHTLIQVVTHDMNEEINTSRLILEGYDIENITYDEFLNEKELTHLFLGDNPLHPPENQAWFKHPSLVHLDLTDCNLGPITPKAFQDLPKLRLLNMAGNHGCEKTREIALKWKASYRVLCGDESNLKSLYPTNSGPINESDINIVENASVLRIPNTTVLIISAFVWLFVAVVIFHV